MTVSQFQVPSWILAKSRPRLQRSAASSLTFHASSPSRGASGNRWHTLLKRGMKLMRLCQRRSRTSMRTMSVPRVNKLAPMASNAWETSSLKCRNRDHKPFSELSTKVMMMMGFPHKCQRRQKIESNVRISQDKTHKRHCKINMKS